MYRFRYRRYFFDCFTRYLGTFMEHALDARAERTQFSLALNQFYQTTSQNIGIARGRPRGPWPPNPSWTKTRIFAEPAPRKARGSSPPIDMLSPPSKKFTRLKTAAFVLNFKVCPPPSVMNAWPLLVLCCRLWI